MAGFHTKTFLKHDDYMTPKYAWENITQAVNIYKIWVLMLFMITMIFL